MVPSQGAFGSMHVAGRPPLPGERSFVTWIYNFPLWVFALLTIGTMCALAAGGLYIVLRRKRADEIQRNDVAGAIVATAGTILAVMLSFMLVTVWQEFDNSAANVQTEAGALSDLHSIADGFPVPLRDRLHADIDGYVDDVITREWRMMRQGQQSDRAHGLAYAIQHELSDYVAPNEAQSTLQAQALDISEKFIDARRRRLFDNNQGIPIPLWLTMIVITGLTVYFTYLFHISNVRMHFVMIVGLTAIIAVIFVMIAELDYPFRGTLMGPDAFKNIRTNLHRPIEGPIPYY